jgi:hypothetical protein
VLAVSEDQRMIDYAERKAARCEQVAPAGPDALSVLAPANISTVRELRLGTPGTGPQPARDCRSRSHRLVHCRHHLRLEELMTDPALVTRLRTELEQPTLIAALPAATLQRLNRAT